MAIRMDPAPYFQRNYGSRSSDRGVKDAVGPTNWANTIRWLGQCGWPVTDDSPDTLVFDAVQCFQEGYGLTGRLAVDRYPGQFTRRALRTSVENGGAAWTNFRFREMRDWRTGWIRARYELMLPCQTARTAKGRAFTAASWYRMRSSNAAVGGSSGSRHQYAEACDPKFLFGLTLREAYQMGMMTGLGVVDPKGGLEPTWDSIVVHIDVGGLCEKGSNRRNRARGVQDPMVWPYHPTQGRALPGRYLTGWNLGPA